MSQTRMTSTTVYLREEELVRLKELARSRRVPMAALIREGISKVLECQTREAQASTA